MQTVLQSHAIHDSNGRGSEEELLTSCSTKATLEGVVSIMRIGSSRVRMAAATAIRNGAKLKACVLSCGAVVRYLSSACACTWFALHRDSQAHTAADPAVPRSSTP